MLFTHGEGAGSELKAIKALRLFRLAKLLRLSKLRDLLSAYEEQLAELAGIAKGLGYVIVICE